MNDRDSATIIVAGCVHLAYVPPFLRHISPDVSVLHMYGEEALRLIEEPRQGIILVVTETNQHVNSGIPCGLSEDGRIAGALLVKRMREMQPWLPFILINPQGQKVLQPDGLLRFIDIPVLSRPDGLAELATELLGQRQIAA